jgi:hypothetical protein
MDDDFNPVGTEPEIGDEPPEVSIGLIISTFRTRGFINTINDDVLGPHVHLFLLLSIVLVITLIIGVISLAI